MNALQSLHNGALSGKREQCVYTPQCVVDALLELWPEGIACDPCWGPGSIVPASVRFGREPDPGRTYYQEFGVDGCAFSCWPLRTYVNPPFDKLKPWINLFLRSWECVLLTPVRPHRKWWRPLLMPQQRVCWLDPLAFVGFEQVFPAPLALVYRGSRDFARATRGLGDVL